jgi:hypothetical protein
MLKNTLTNAAATAITRAVEAAWFVAGTSLVLAERAFGASKATTGVAAQALRAIDPRNLHSHTATTPTNSSTTPATFEPFEELADLSDILEPEDTLDDADTTGASTPLVQLTADESDTNVRDLLEELVFMHQELSEDDPAESSSSENRNAPF